MNQQKIKGIIEAALMVSDKPLNMAQFEALFAKDMEFVDRELIKAALEALQEDYRDRGIELKEVASGYRIQVKSDYAEWVNRLFEERPPRYSRALLETLAIIAYRQPVTRAEIEDIRGVGISSTIIKTLQEREWIRVVGHKDIPGRPELLATTREFLDYFNLKKLSDLPTLAEIRELTKLNPDLFDALANPKNSGTGIAEQTAETVHEVSLDEAVLETPASGDDKVVPISS
ncbi:MAG: SMC-Scp complex subunit ScpB [Gammaproteobacteria bacterium]